MDGGRGPKDSRERLYPRALSRASTPSSANMSTTTKSANSSSSHLREASHTGSHPAHKYHHSHCGSVGGSRPISRLSGEPGEELREPVTATSSLLQEQLQKERRIESERQAGRQGSDLSVSTGDIRDSDVKGSPIRRSATAMGRREKLDGSDEPVKDTGMGVRQMEETLSTLHKQNWDLKVQLFHRRKQQIILEAKLQTVETRNKEMLDLHESMLSSLQAKDETHKSLGAEIDEKTKALGEAVSLIIKLEARVDELLREREMVRQVEADEPYRYSPTHEVDLEPAIAGTTKMENLHIPRLTENAKKLGRMPSFLSDRGEETENLRNVVLRGQKSAMRMRMRKVSESSADPSEINRIASPLSVLSESSFVSIYGPKESRENTDLQLSDDVGGMDGSYIARSATPAKKSSKESWNSEKYTASSQMPAVNPSGGAKLSTRMQSINNILDMNSPLQKLERLEGQMAAADDSYSQDIPPNRSRGTATPTPRSTNPQQQGRSKHEKREALQRVMTNYPTHRDFANSHAFPPTPDTVSSSTLRKHQNFTSSQDSLMRQVVTGQGEGAFAVPDRPRTATREPTYHTSYPEQQAYATNLSGRTQVPMPNMNTHPYSSISQLAQSLPRRPHSAAETTSSRARADSVGSDSDSDGGADAHSEADSFDYWMRESMKPNRHETVSSEQRRNNRAPSPDLFSFPSDAQGWETDVMFGALRGNGYLGSPVPGLKRDPLDEMASSLQTPQAETFDPALQGTAPPTPDRRSSLHARTGSTSAAPSGGKLRKHPARGNSTGWIDTRGRSNSIDSAAQAPSNRTQRQQPEAAATPGKRNHYPPISGQATKGRGLGLNTFFKRSGSESYSVPSSATDATFPLPTPNQLPALAPMMPSSMAPGRNSVPPPAAMPWLMRPPVAPEDDFASATPPPIMRNRGLSLLSGIGGLELADPATPHRVAEMATPSTPTTVIPPQGGNTSTTPAGAQSGGKRKWLGLGRMGSLKNRTG
ncbi:hypothetical protein F4820DRAFT_445344 [Hypoxylon rubiginosum]|uniref:Uncharacterized protein n=1 Tax=Hypoxylon rubiginosum TaxID=110542 RepID=A0ACB9Z8R7_9PEZI|nr:hypothetical protein F4820DRAFT_445344 [Hypoxylon rubiginosum]